MVICVLLWRNVCHHDGVVADWRTYLCAAFFCSDSTKVLMV